MANIQNRLCNASGFEVEIRWHAGIDILIPGDGWVDLEANQMGDFRDGQPGSEAVRETMDHFALFLRDADRTYEAQMLEAVQRSVRSKETLHKGVVANLRKSRLSEGLNDTAEVFEELLESVGQVELRKQIEALKRREKTLAKHVSAEAADKPVHEDLDPKKTLFFEDGTYKLFATEIALEIYLGEPGRTDLKKRHEEFLAAQHRGADDQPATIGEV